MQTRVINRYSSALFEASIRVNALNDVASDCGKLIDLIDKEKSVKMFFLSPVIKKEKKIEVAEKLFSAIFNKLTFGFIILLIKGERENLIREIMVNFLARKDEKENILKPSVTTAFEFDENQKKEFTKKLNEYTGKNCIPDYSVNKDLIGGFKIKFDDIIIDGSVKRQLELMKNKLKEKSLL